MGSVACIVIVCVSFVSRATPVSALLKISIATPVSLRPCGSLRPMDPALQQAITLAATSAAAAAVAAAAPTAPSNASLAPRERRHAHFVADGVSAIQQVRPALPGRS